MRARPEWAASERGLHDGGLRRNGGVTAWRGGLLGPRDLAGEQGGDRDGQAAA